MRRVEPEAWRCTDGGRARRSAENRDSQKSDEGGAGKDAGLKLSRVGLGRVERLVLGLARALDVARRLRGHLVAFGEDHVASHQGLPRFDVIAGALVDGSEFSNARRRVLQ